MLNTSMIIQPESVQNDFAITTYCQAKCRSCQRTNQDTGEPEDWLTPTHMSYELFDRIVNNCPSNLTIAQFCGELGDPMMHPQITKFVDRIFSKKSIRRLIINTNGGLRDPEWYTRMGENYGLKLCIHFGIDGMSHETNWKYREGVNWQRAIDNMVALSKTKSDLEWHFLIFEWNWQEVEEAYNFAKKHNINIIFKFNRRHVGLISSENKQACEKIIEKLL